MFEIQIVSDLHLENPSAYNLFEIPARAPCLALLGDIGVVADDGFFSFIEAQLQQFEIVFLLLGNHEPWHSSWSQTKAKIYDFSDSAAQRRTNQEKKGGCFVFLDRTRYDISPTVTILGCTLWSEILEPQMERVSFGINDFYYTLDWTVEDHNAAHEGDLKWLNDQVAEISASDPDRQIVILSHYSPVGKDTRAIDPRHVKSPLSSGFATDLSAHECWRNPQVCLWAFGHTHYNTHYKEEETGKLIMSNQRGYYFSQADRFDPGKVVHIA
ncbi:hypothetical protein N7462_005881 [Penicillium macrosclerotiorum]|uniref:uncharacterized protein n=1 Tax=Penicillium macrosclerotiorum TaxID=303699 RepID=UPI0025479390|nr:uncharacterized protein N7462_005881 [Penicillium macrosclerotiorum]KAJ5682716.1 hypothetical protein N7462_005881 [Penicillium macrosclerotiorum]